MDSPFQPPGFSITRVLKQSADDLALLGYQQSLNRRCFIRASRSPLGVNAIQSEIAVLSTCQHDAMLELISRGDHDGWTFIATEYASKGSLADALRAGLSVRQLIKVIAAVGSALRHLQQNGLTHNAVSMESILMRTDGGAVLGDYRWASTLHQPVTDLAALSAMTRRIGTSSPEVLRGQQAGVVNDFFALGVVLFQALVGEQPFHGDSTEALLEQITQRPLAPVPQQFLAFRPLLEALLTANPEHRAVAIEQFDTLLNAISIESDWRSITLRNQDVDAQEIRVLGGNLLVTDADGRPSKRTLRRKRRQRRTVIGLLVMLSGSLLVGAAYLVEPARFMSIDSIAASLGLADDPELVEAWAEARSLRQDPNQGLAAIAAAYQRVLALDPEHRAAKEALTTLFAKWKQDISSALVNDNTELAAMRLEEAITLLPGDPEINLLSLQLQNRYRAERLLLSTEALLTSHGLGDLPSAAAAIQSYQEILRLAPNHPDALQGLEQLASHYVGLSKQAAVDGEVAQAIRYLERATAADGSLRSLDDARRLISEATTAQAAIEELLRQGDRLRQRGQRLLPKGESAVERYQQVLATDPDNAKAMRAMNELAVWVVQEGGRLIQAGSLAEVELLVTNASIGGIREAVVDELRSNLEREVERRESVATLLQGSRELFAKGLITEPVERNAVMLLRQVQQLDPRNQSAAEMLQQCAQRLAAAAIEAHEFGLLADADQYLTLALTIQPDRPEWLALESQWQRN